MGRFIGDRVWRVSGVLTNTGATAVELARFNYLSGRLAGTRFLELNGAREQPVLREGRASTTQRADAEAYWQDMGVTWPRFADPVADEKGWFASTDYAAFTNGWNEPGWGFGFVAPGNAFGEIGYRGDGDSADMYAGVRLDGVTLGARKHLRLEEVLVWCGDLQSGLNLWMRTCAAELHARKSPPPMVGYCSWHQLYGDVRQQDVERATLEFQHWPVPPGGRLIQVDAGWQVAQGDWRPNGKFEDWRSLPARIAATGSVPGLWIAPLMVAAGHAIVKEHPDWLQRLPDGTPAITFPGGAAGVAGTDIHFLDPDHPAVQVFISDTFRRLESEGWRYFKVDFTYPVTGARYARGRTKTGFQSQRELYQQIRAALGPDVIVNACVGALARYAIGSADVARIGGDATFKFQNVKDSVHQSLSRFATNGLWFQADADCFSMRSLKSQLDAEERRLLTGTIGLSAGIFLTSDYPSQWSVEDAAFVRQFWNERGPRVPDEQYVAWTRDGEIIAYRVSHRDGSRALHRVALYNWTGESVTTFVALEAIHLGPRVRLTATAGSAGYSLDGGIISVTAQPPHSMRIVDLIES
ncbi:MAG: alpha-galactosidase [Gammaproteobacteria bacterium]|nr:alpha-galactosidase [Gammaproteobacteria bacterium]